MPYPALVSAAPSHSSAIERMYGPEPLRARLSLLFMDSVARPEVAPGNPQDMSEWVLQSKEDAPPVRIACYVQSTLIARSLFEMVGYSGTTLAPGWLFQTTAQWLLCFFPTNEVVALPVAELRELIMDHPNRLESASVIGEAGFSWYCVEDIDYLAWKLPFSRVLDLHLELNEPHRELRLLGPHQECRASSADELLTVMRRGCPGIRQQINSRRLKELLIRLNLTNRMRNAPGHRDLMDQVPWELPA